MKKLIIFLTILTMVLGLSAFSCSSTEITSAKLYIQQKNLVKAEEVLLKEVKKNPKSDEGYYLLGLVYSEKKDIPNMLENYDKSIAISKKFAKEINNAKKFHWAGNFNKGVAYFNRASRVTSKDSMVMFSDKAIAAFNNAIKCEPDSADTYNNLAYAYLNRGMYDKAIEPLTAMLKIKKTADAYGRLGQIFYTKAANQMIDFKNGGNVADSVASMKNYNKAIAILEEGHKAFPTDDNINNHLFNSYIGAHKENVAMAKAKELVDTHPDSKSNRYNYGSLLLQKGEYSKAVDQFKAALKIEPNYTNAIYNLAVTYVKWGGKIRLDDEAAEKNSDRYKEKFEKALPYLEHYVQTKDGSNDPAIWELLGKVYANLGKTEKSKSAFSTADQLRK